MFLRLFIGAGVLAYIIKVVLEYRKLVCEYLADRQNNYSFRQRRHRRRVA